MMVELKVSGKSRYDYGPTYVKYLLDEFSDPNSPGKLENIASQVKLLESLGIISEPVASAVMSFIERSASGVLP